MYKVDIAFKSLKSYYGRALANAKIFISFLNAKNYFHSEHSKYFSSYEQEV